MVWIQQEVHKRSNIYCVSFKLTIRAAGVIAVETESSRAAALCPSALGGWVRDGKAERILPTAATLVARTTHGCRRNRESVTGNVDA